MIPFLLGDIYREIFLVLWEKLIVVGETQMR